VHVCAPRALANRRKPENAPRDASQKTLQTGLFLVCSLQRAQGLCKVFGIKNLAVEADWPLPWLGMAEKTISGTVEARMSRKPGRLFTYADFADLPPSAVASALSRLRARGKVVRARKGVYFIPRRTVLGEVSPDPVRVGQAITENAFPAGLTASNVLGLTRQVPARLELAVPDRRLTPPEGIEFKVRTGVHRRGLRPDEAALLEVLRDIRHLSDLSPSATIDHLAAVVGRRESRRRLIRAAPYEPPRVRAMLGALAEETGATRAELEKLRRSLNRTSRFDFGPLTALPTAESWGAR
jgi:hypothetical protein